jgi:mercuric ion transport protein
MTTAGTVAATILCCLPFATGLIGASLAAIGSQFAPFRPYLIALSVGLLAYAFYQAYRPNAVVCVGGECRSVVEQRPRRLALWVVAVMVALLLSAVWWANWIIYWSL